VIAKTSEKGNYQSFKKYLKKVLYKYNNKEKIVMILDNVRYHHAKLLKPFLEKHDQKLELIYLPPYSPDLNPMERVWWYMRKKITHNRYMDSLKVRKKKFWQMFSYFDKPNQEIIDVCSVNY
jgi:transposase